MNYYNLFKSHTPEEARAVYETNDGTEPDSQQHALYLSACCWSVKDESGEACHCCRFAIDGCTVCPLAIPHALASERCCNGLYNQWRYAGANPAPVLAYIVQKLKEECEVEG